MIVLGIETSCDETAVAVVRNGREVLSMLYHLRYPSYNIWGVVPEIASRKHVEKINRL